MSSSLDSAAQSAPRSKPMSSATTTWITTSSPISGTRPDGDRLRNIHGLVSAVERYRRVGIGPRHRHCERARALIDRPAVGQAACANHRGRSTRLSLGGGSEREFGS